VRKRAGGCQPGGAQTGVMIGDAPLIAAAEDQVGFEPTTPVGAVEAAESMVAGLLGVVCRDPKLGPAGSRAGCL